jgi:hypothetical protein
MKEKRFIILRKPTFWLKVTLFFVLFSVNRLQADWLWNNDVAVATLTPKGYQVHFSFVNQGKTDLTVTDLAFSCPCTLYHFKATTAKPGQTGRLDITIEDTEERLADDDWIAIASGPPSTKPRELTIRLDKPDAGK